ncbi:MAG TPA: site-2 protease family protein, partial [Gammaproteobacteria bacterium]|nr:site-2 protease family protein [Gammaproteobacteria bacterium]
MDHGIRLGSVAGIEIRMDWSLLAIFLLILVSLGAGSFPMLHPQWSPLLVWGTAFVASVLFFASVLAHELSHALVGRIYGITVRRITLFIFGGLAHMEDEPRQWRGELLMALAGPVTSLALGVGFVVLGNLAVGPEAVNPARPEETLAGLSPAATMLFWLGPVNIILGVFNLVPGFPLDGGRVLRAVMWGVTGNMRRATRWASRAGQGFAWLLIFTGVSLILGVRLPFLGTGPLNGLWLAFIGWFLN